MENLNDVRDFLSEMPYINSGGCGISALAMYYWLGKKNRLNNDTKFVLLCRSFNSELHKLNNNSGKKTLPNLLYVPNHICLKYNGKYIDCDSNCIDKNYDYKLEIDLTNLMDIINNPHPNSGWNIAFDRRKVKFIEDTLEIDLSDVKIN